MLEERIRAILSELRIDARHASICLSCQQRLRERLGCRIEYDGWERVVAEPGVWRRNGGLLGVRLVNTRSN